MRTVTITEEAERLRKLPAGKLAVTFVPIASLQPTLTTPFSVQVDLQQGI